MSLYREARSGRRRLWIAAGAALALVAVIVGIVVLSGGEQSEADKLRSLQEDVQPALAALELVPIHFESTNPTTRAAAADQLAVARRTGDEHVDELRALDAAGTETLIADLEELDRLVRTTTRVDDVERATQTAARDLRRVVGLD